MIMMVIICCLVLFWIFGLWWLLVVFEICGVLGLVLFVLGDVMVRILLLVWVRVVE